MASPTFFGDGVSYSMGSSPRTTGGGAGSSSMSAALDSPRTPGGGAGSSGAGSARPRVPVFSPTLPSFPTFSSVDKVAAQQSIVDFGGVPDGEALGVRSSARIRAQHNADDTQMGRAIALADQRDSIQGYPYGGALDPTMGLLATFGPAGTYGGWMHTAPVGGTGFFLPAYVAAY